jgi:hypothetical protein
MTRARATRTAAALGLCLATLTGCGGPPSDPVRWPADPTSDTPAIDWPNGAPDTSDEWVATLLDYQIAMAVARNTHDYSRPALAALATHEHIASWAGGAWGQASHRENLHDTGSIYAYRPGPYPMTVRDVDAEGDDATVSVCIPPEWMTVDGPALDPDDLAAGNTGKYNGHTMLYTLRREPDGHIVVTDDCQDGGCDLGNPRAGYVDPPPPYGDRVWAEEVIGPDGRPIQESW